MLRCAYVTFCDKSCRQHGRIGSSFLFHIQLFYCSKFVVAGFVIAFCSVTCTVRSLACVIVWRRTLCIHTDRTQHIYTDDGETAAVQSKPGKSKSIEWVSAHQKALHFIQNFRTIHFPTIMPFMLLVPVSPAHLIRSITSHFTLCCGTFYYERHRPFIMFA